MLRCKQKIWISRVIFENFLKQLDGRMGLQKSNIILIVDRGTARINLNLKHVQIEFFLANCTIQLQPCDQGMIHFFFKVPYREQLLRKVLPEIDSGILDDACKTKVNLLEELNVIFTAWNNAINSCIVKILQMLHLQCFPKTTMNTMVIMVSL